MKKIFSANILLTFCLVILAAVGAAQTPQPKNKIPKPIAKSPGKQLVDSRPDLGFRQAVYLTASETGKIDLLHDTYVAAGKTILIKPGQPGVHHYTDSQYVTVNVGAILTRKGGNLAEPLKTYAGFKCYDDATGTHILTFPAKQPLVEYDAMCNFFPGLHKLIFWVNPDKKIDESNDKNNSLEVTLNVVIP